MAARKGSGRGPGRSAAPPGSVGPGEFVVYPGVPSGVYDLLERLSAAAGDSPDFGTPGLSLDRTRLTVRWFGELPAAVRAVVDSAGPGFAITVQPTDFRPGELRAEAGRLVREHGDVVAAATARPEGDGVEVVVPPEVAEPAGSAEAAALERGVTSSYPLSFEVGSAV